jgi:hypothetical protein
MKTAVEFLASVLSQTGPITKDDFNSLVEQAKQMEKKQLVDTYVVGYGKGITHGAINPEQYYNETFKKQKTLYT